MQNTPLYSTLCTLAEKRGKRFHMPGHKGKAILPDCSYALDYTETHGTGNLYEQTGPIREAERLAAAYYGASDCHFLTGGSTQGIHAMLCAAVGEGGTVLLDRACHKSALSACALFDLTPSFVYPPIQEPYGFTGRLEEAQVYAALLACPEAKAMMVVSPNYYGITQDIPMLARLCHQAGKWLLVDAAHGAHFPAVGLQSPVQLGADAATLSAHKTLPALGQGAYLIFSDTLDGMALRRAEAMVGTSSPSYPIMASLDCARAWLEETQAYTFLCEQAQTLRTWITQRTPFEAVQSTFLEDPCRLVIYCGQAGMTGQALDQILYEQYQIACEMADERVVVCILTGADDEADLRCLAEALYKIGKGCRPTAVPPPLPAFPPPEQGCSVRQAWFAPCETVADRQAVGRICARPITPYPPGIPILWPGEKIHIRHIEFLQQICYTTSVEIDVVSL